MIILLAVLLVMSMAAAVSAGTVYPYTPGEIMYLAGIERAAYREGVCYSLYDTDRDDIPELFVLDNNGGAGKLDIYRYDPAANEARPILSADHVTEVYAGTCGGSVFMASAEGQTVSYHEYVFSGDTPEEKTVLRSGDEGYEFFGNGSADSPEPLSWVDSGQWADGSIVGVASHIPDPGLQNDFYLSSNYEWLSEIYLENVGQVFSPVNDIEKTVYENKLMMFADREKYRSEDIRRVRDFYDMAAD